MADTKIKIISISLLFFDHFQAEVISAGYTWSFCPSKCSQMHQTRRKTHSGVGLQSISGEKGVLQCRIYHKNLIDVSMSPVSYTFPTNERPISLRVKLYYPKSLLSHFNPLICPHQNYPLHLSNHKKMVWQHYED